MFITEYPRRGMSSPWGIIHEATPVGGLQSGVVQISTASHGGLWVSPAARARMNPYLAAFPTWTKNPAWWEEDMDAAVVVIAFPDLFPPDALAYALKSTSDSRGADGYFASLRPFWESEDGRALLDSGL